MVARGFFFFLFIFFSSLFLFSFLSPVSRIFPVLAEFFPFIYLGMRAKEAELFIACCIPHPIFVGCDHTNFWKSFFELLNISMSLTLKLFLLVLCTHPVKGCNPAGLAWFKHQTPCRSPCGVTTHPSLNPSSYLFGDHGSVCFIYLFIILIILKARSQVFGCSCVVFGHWCLRKASD